MERKHPIEILTHPLTVLAGIAAGTLLGLFHAGLSGRIAPLGEVFISLMKMCAMPIMITMIALGIARMLKERQAKRYLSALLVFCVCACACASLLGLLFGFAAGRVLVDNGGMRSVLSKLLIAPNSGVAASAMSFKELISGIVPQNVFRALADGQFLPLMFFFILFGIALGRSKEQSGNVVLQALDGINEAFFKIINWFIYLMPIALFAIFAETFSKYGKDTLYGLGGLILACHIGCLIFIAAYAAIIFAARGKAAARAALSLRQALLVGLGTTSSLAAMPFAIKALENGFNIAKRETKLIFPLGMILNVQITVFFVTMVVSLVCRIYGVAVGSHEAAVIVLGSFCFALCATGMPAIASVAMLAVVFSPLGIPVEAAVVLFIVLLPLVDPVLTLTNILGNCTATILVTKLAGEDDRGKAVL
ncbi:MAG: cation:dicarboxylase symporter family transporter [Elusimicrobiales bacterium]|nr:cation:dicarboxylase symporter family transporter [Elusimicrobiales bacterium]